MQTATCRVGNRERPEWTMDGGVGRLQKCGEATEEKILNVSAHDTPKGGDEARTKNSVEATEDSWRWRWIGKEGESELLPIDMLSEDRYEIMTDNLVLVRLRKIELKTSEQQYKHPI